MESKGCHDKTIFQFLLANFFAELFCNAVILSRFSKRSKMDFHFLTNDKNEMIKNAEFWMKEDMPFHP